MSLDGRTSPNMEDEADCVNLDTVNLNPTKVLMDYYLEMVDACEVGNEELLSSLMEELTDDQARVILGQTEAGTLDKYRGSLLESAVFAHTSSYGPLRYLLTHPCINIEEEVDTPTDWHFGYPKRTALVLACQQQYREVVNILLEHGADPNNGHGYAMPLLEACSSGNCEIVDALIKHGADLMYHPSKCVDPEICVSLPFYVACLNGNLEVVQTLLVHLNNSESKGISLEQLVLCRSVLGLKLITISMDEEGVSLWRKSIDDFRAIARRRHPFLGPADLSNMLYSLYVSESSLVQQGKRVELGKDFLVRTHTRFPDFKLCVNSTDINTVFQSQSGTTLVHNFFLRSCVTGDDFFWTGLDISFSKSLNDIGGYNISPENRRLCILLVLETGLYRNQCNEMILEKTMEQLMSVVIGRRLYQHNPGYVMLLLDVVNCALEGFICQSPALNMLDNAKAKIGRSFLKIAELFSKFSHLILGEITTDQETSHLAGVVRKFIVLAQKSKEAFPHTWMECQVLISTVGLLLYVCPAVDEEQEQANNTQSLREAAMKLLHSLLRCGINPNSRDDKGNTVMLLVMGLDEPYCSDTIELLMAFGGHVDVRNYVGNSPYQILQTLTSCRVDRLQCRNLKCRAASAITFFKIPYKHRMPKDLVEFISLHDTHTPTSI